MMNHLAEFEIVERLTLQQQFRLVEIAFDTRDSSIRNAAIDILQRSLNPMFIANFKGPEHDTNSPQV